MKVPLLAGALRVAQSHPTSRTALLTIRAMSNGQAIQPGTWNTVTIMPKASALSASGRAGR